IHVRHMHGRAGGGEPDVSGAGTKKAGRADVSDGGRKARYRRSNRAASCQRDETGTSGQYSVTIRVDSDGGGTLDSIPVGERLRTEREKKRDSQPETKCDRGRSGSNASRHWGPFLCGAAAPWAAAARRRCLCAVPAVSRAV